MIGLLVLFGKPVDAAEFDRYFEQEHFPLAALLPGLQDIRVNRVVGAVEGVSGFHMVLELGFDSAEELQNSLNSSAGQAMARDYSNFASGGTELLICHLETSPMNAH